MRPRDRDRRLGHSRRLRLTLCMLMLGWALCAWGLAAYLRIARSYTTQHRAAMELAAQGAELEWRPIEPGWWRSVLNLLLEPIAARQCIAVHAEHAGLEDDDLAWLQFLPHLKKLYLARNPISDRGLVHVRGLRKLQRLSLWGTDITDEGMRHVGQLGSLKVLDIHDSSLYHRFGSQPARRNATTTAYPRTSSRFLSCRCLQYLKDASDLRALYFTFPVDEPALAHLAALPSVRMRTLVLTDISPRGFSILPQLRDIEQLTIRRGNVGSDGFAHLGRLPHLQQLRLDMVQAERNGWRSIRDLTSVQELSLSLCSVSDDTLKHVGALEQLKDLSLTQSSVTDQGIAHLARLTKLERLVLRGTQATSDCLKYLGAMHGLRTLGLHVPLDDEAVQWLARLPRLPRLEQLSGPELRTFYKFYLSDAGLADLARLQCFRYGEIYDAREGEQLPGIDLTPGKVAITDVGLARIWEGTPFQLFNVHGQNVTAAGLRWGPGSAGCARVELRSSLPASQVIAEKLHFGAGHAKFGYGSLKVEARKGWGPHVVDFHFQRDVGQLKLLPYLPDIKQLSLDMHPGPHHDPLDWDNLRCVLGVEEFIMEGRHDARLRIGAVGIRRLGQMQGLRKAVLDVSFDIGPEDLAPLGELKHLEQLDLWCGPLNAGQLQHLARLDKLTSLRIFGTPRSLDTSVDLRHLTRLTQLKELWLYGLDDDAAPWLGEMKSLNRLSLQDHHFRDDSFCHLEQLPHLEYLDARTLRMTRSQLEELDRRLADTYVRTDGGGLLDGKPSAGGGDGE